MANAAHESSRNPGRAASLFQFAATAAGFLVSAYLVSTVIFDWGPAQDIPPWVRIAVSSAALCISIGVVLGLAYAASRGYHAWKLENGRLLIFRREGAAPACSLQLNDIQRVKARDDDWDVIARAEGDDLEAVGLREAGRELPGEKSRHHGELEIHAGGKLYLVITEDTEAARKAALEIEAARRGKAA